MAGSNSERIASIRAARLTYEQTREAYQQARDSLVVEILRALSDGIGPSAVARESGFTREYVAKIRDRARSDEPS